METTDKVRENRLRRMAKRQGFALEKSRTRDPRALDFGLYRLVPVEPATMRRFDVIEARDMDEVERFLTTGERGEQ